MTDSPTQSERAERFRALHEGEPFVMPNPWDPGSAKLLASLGFEALATTSAGFAFTLGRADGDVALGEVVEHTRVLAEATGLPVSVDLENGYGDEPEDAARAISAVAEAGAVGGSIEDYGHGAGIYEIAHATERVAAAVEAARALDFPFTLTARAENFVRGNPDLDDTIARLRAFEDAGAHVLYAPRLTELDQVRAVCEAITAPVNVLVRPEFTVAEVTAAGGQRISVGGNLAWVAYTALADAATRIRDEGDLSAAIAANADVDAWLSA